MNRLQVSHALARWARGAGVLVATMFLWTSAMADVTLAWDPVSNANGYVLYYGTTAGSYESKIDVGNVTTFTLQGLTEGQTYHFAATGYDVDGGESELSNDAAAAIPYRPPVAAFSASTTTGMAPLAMNLVDTSTGTIASYAWSFGDGTTSSSASPSHVYSAPGVYSVGLTVTGPGGSSTVMQNNLVTVTASTAAPVAQFTSSVTTGVAPLDVQFTSTSSGVVASYKWMLGDGTTSIEPSPTHKYGAAGRYTVTLIVTNAAGSSTVTKTRYIDVKRHAP